MSQPDADYLKRCLAVAEEAAAAAAAVTGRYFRQPIDVISKSDESPVTKADREAETAARTVFEKHFPEHGIIGEEHGVAPGTSGIDWIIDPIDGTRGFIAGTPTWGTLIAATAEGRPVYGMVDQPYTRERFEGVAGRALLNGPRGHRRLETRAGARLADAILFTTFPEVGTAADRQGFEAVAARARLVRYGMDCYAYALLAAGHADLVIEAGLSNYDIAAPLALIEAAGGVVTDWKGGPAWHGGQVLAAANPDLHAEALALLGPYAA